MIRVYTQYYRDVSELRQRELDEAWANNLRNRFVDQLWMILPETVECPRVPPEDAARVRALPQSLLAGPRHPSSRPTFAQLLALAKQQTTWETDIHVIANSDISFDETLGCVLGIESDQAYALSRWELQAGLFNEPGSQDAWVFRGTPRAVEGIDFVPGYPGCDVRFNYQLFRAGYRVCNPSKTIRAWHHHASQVRNYPANQVHVKGFTGHVPPPYLRVKPAYLGEPPQYPKKPGDLRGT